MANDITISVHEDTNSNITLFEGQEPVFAIAEERITRNKFQEGFPENGLKKALEWKNIALKDISRFIAGNRFHFLPRLPFKALPGEEHNFFGSRHRLYLYYHHILTKNTPLNDLIHFFNKTSLKLRYPKVENIVDHHEAHAYSAYLTSGFADPLVITIDNMGDGYSAKVFRAGSGKCEFLYGSSAINSAGQFYGEIAQFLGFHNLMAGKVTGLAAHGDSHSAYHLMEELFSVSRNGKDFIAPSLLTSRKRKKIFEQLRSYSRADIAAGAQKRLEDVIMEYVRTALKEKGSTDIALAGGVFANVRVNQRIKSLSQVRNIFIHPAMTDQGISMGAGLKILAEAGKISSGRIKNIYLGPSYSENEAGDALEKSGLKYQKVKDIEKEVADLLLSGRVVARFKGRMEYGLRALGNRSILYKTTDRSVNDWLNRRLRRNEFMPFAPSTMKEFAGECYSGYEGAEEAARFMTITFDCTDRMKKLSPGVVHLDGTARPQVVHEEDNPEFYRILRIYHEGSGIPGIINTSFNMHEEPIVCSPDDAIRAFTTGRLDYLAIESFLVKNECDIR
jgi:carbamoyltransferase